MKKDNKVIHVDFNKEENDPVEEVIDRLIMKGRKLLSPITRFFFPDDK